MSARPDVKRPGPFMRSKTIVCLMALASVAAGCAVGPNFHRPAPPTVSSYTPPQAPVSKTIGSQHLVNGAVIPNDWWRLYQSPKLDALVARALTANSDLAAARAALKAAHETTLAEAGVLLPTVDASLGSSRNKSSQYLSPVLNAEQFYYTLQTAQLTVGYTLDVFGGLRRQVEGAKAAEAAQRFQTEGVYLTLVSNVVAAAVQDASLRSQVDAQTHIIALETEISSIMRGQLRLGQIARSDLLIQDAALAQAQAALPPLQKQAAIARDLLAYLTGRTPGEGGLEDVDLETLTLPRDLPLGLPSRLVEQRPDVRAAEENLHAASAAVGVAVAARLPTLTLTATAGGAGGTFSRLFSHGNDFWTYGAGVAQPIFEGGQLYRKQKAAEASLTQAQDLYRSAVLGAFQNVADALQALAVDARALDAAKAAQSAAADSLDIARQQLARGQIAGVAVLASEQTLSEAQLALIQAQAARFTDTAALIQALGGGWWSSTRTPPPSSPPSS